MLKVFLKLHARETSAQSPDGSGLDTESDTESVA